VVAERPGLPVSDGRIPLVLADVPLVMADEIGMNMRISRDAP
jgi:hypothetical protein